MPQSNDCNDELLQQNVLFSKMIEYFLDKGIITQAHMMEFLADFNQQNEEEILRTSNPIHNQKKPDWNQKRTLFWSCGEGNSK